MRMGVVHGDVVKVDAEGVEVSVQRASPGAAHQGGRSAAGATATRAEAAVAAQRLKPDAASLLKMFGGVAGGSGQDRGAKGKDRGPDGEKPRRVSGDGSGASDRPVPKLVHSVWTKNRLDLARVQGPAPGCGASGGCVSDVRLIADEVEELTVQSKNLGNDDYFGYYHDSEMDAGSSSAWCERLGVRADAPDEHFDRFSL